MYFKMYLTYSKKKPLLIIIMLISLVIVQLRAKSIENVFPGVFLGKTGINVSSNAIRTANGNTINGYIVKPYFLFQKNRNHWNDRDGAPITYLIMHYTVYNFPDTILKFMSNETSNRASAHYVITGKEQNIPSGIVVQVVTDDKRAWHAGISAWGKDKNLNSESLGIEHVNPGFVINDDSQVNWFPFDEDQIRTSGILSQDIVRKYKISPTHVLGHADIAPFLRNESEDIHHDFKEDPGVLFPWGKLYHDYGVGAWLDDNEVYNPQIITQKYAPKEPLPKTISRSFFFRMLRQYGYSLPTDIDFTRIDETQYWLSISHKLEPVIKAFKAHFSANGKPELYNTEITKAEIYWIWALVAKYQDYLIKEQ